VRLRRDVKIFMPCQLKNDRVGGEPQPPVRPQNRAYGSVHGSSRKPYPLTHIQPMRELPVAVYVLSHDSREPLRGKRLVHRPGLR
jgi:hypothetical protein